MRKKSHLHFLIYAFVWFCGCCTARGAADSFADCAEHHKMMLREAVRASTMTDGVRENHIFENLSFAHGSRAQVLRIVWWGNEKVPQLRKELVRQWINDSRPNPTPDETMAKFMGMVAHFSPEAKSARKTEIEGVLEEFRQNPAEMRQVKNAECWVEGDVSIAVLNALDETVLFSGESARWRDMITRLPEPLKLDGGDDVNGSIYLQLVTLCPTLNDTALETKLMNGATPGYYSRFYTMDERLKELPTTLQRERIEALKRADKPSWLMLRPLGTSEDHAQPK